MKPKTNRYEFDTKQAYRLVSVTDHHGKDKVRGFYAERLNCITNQLIYDSRPDHDDNLFRMRMRFVENDQGQPIRRGIHTSTVQKVEETENGIKIYTSNSIYILEKAVLKEVETIPDAADLLELYLSLEEDYHFARGFYYDKDKKVHDLEADAHIGMFVDTILIGTHEGSMFGRYLCRYYYNYSNVEIYSLQHCKQILIHNVGTSELEIKFERGSMCWTIQPGESKFITPFNEDGDAPDTDE